jgi:hypothetical protein
MEKLGFTYLTRRPYEELGLDLLIHVKERRRAEI